MLHRDRVHDVIDVPSLEELAGLLTRGAWALTTGFRVEDATFLNDSTSPSAIQEYAVMVRGEQVDSITVEELSCEAVLAIIRAALGDALGYHRDSLGVGKSGRPSARGQKGDAFRERRTDESLRSGASP